MSETHKENAAEPHEAQEAATRERGAGGKPASRRRLLFAVGAAGGVALVAAAAVFALKRPAHPPEQESHEPSAQGSEAASHEPSARGSEAASHENATAHAEAGGEHAPAAHASEGHSPETRTSTEEARASVPVGEHSAAQLPEWLRPLEHAWRRVREKAEVIREALEENRRLRLENANLRVQVESAKMDCRIHESAEKTAEAGEALRKQTGERAGRMLASIKYRPPTHLLPPQLYTLATSYFRAEEFEKAAVILTLLTDMEENNAYGTAKNLVMLGVAWLRVENPQLADEAFTRALDEPERPESVSYQAQARLWKALISGRQGKATKTQFWLRELVDRHPHSIEASWINPGARVPASATHSTPASAPIHAPAPALKQSEKGSGEHGAAHDEGGTGHHDDHSSHSGH